ncbi:MAG: molybdenum cofactor cytidylyltransferase [Arenicella sp.]|jgi:molybdenum cofactor cytidylyltransferase
MTSSQAKSEFACVILAAGLGRRFGGLKMLHPMPNGQTMIEQTIEQYQTAFSQIHIVVTDQDEEIKQCIKKHAEKVKKLDLENQKSFKIVECSDSNLGMSASLIAGVTATIEADGWMIGLGDMPYVASETIVKLTDNLSQSNIVMPCYRKQLGNPVGFGSLFKDELLALRGDRGGKSIIQQHSNLLMILPTQDQGVVFDIDAPDQVR